MNDSDLTFDDLLQDPSGGIGAAMAAGREFLTRTDRADLVKRVGTTIDTLPAADFPDKRWFQKSYGRGVTERPEDYLIGDGLFYLTEQGKLFLDCTGGHYQMTWGYEHPALTALLLDGIRRGVVWDNHSNIPSAPVKRLAAKLVELANPGVDMVSLQSDGGRLNTVLLGTATGSVACAAALKIALRVHEQGRSAQGAPVFVTLDGNYHGTDLFAQYLRGMWEGYFANVESVRLQPNNAEELEAVFDRYGQRIAAFMCEPIMMNREAILLDPWYLQMVRRLTENVGAQLIVDEIQTGFWYPEVLMYKRFGIEPDMVVLGKGMTAGLHPLSALLYRGDLDCLEQYDAISTNGNAALAALLALGCIELIERNAAEIGEIGDYYHGRIVELAGRFPGVIAEARGVGHMSGMKFYRVEDALEFHRRATEAGLWLRVHAYHEGHSTCLTKFALPFDKGVADFAIERYSELLTALGDG